MVKATKQNKIVAPYVSADTFLSSAKPIYQFDDIQTRAFKIRMKSLGKYYLPKIEDFIPYFEEYLGIEREDK